MLCACESERIRDAKRDEGHVKIPCASHVTVKRWQWFELSFSQITGPLIICRWILDGFDGCWRLCWIANIQYSLAFVLRSSLTLFVANGNDRNLAALCDDDYTTRNHTSTIARSHANWACHECLRANCTAICLLMFITSLYATTTVLYVDVEKMIATEKHAHFVQGKRILRLFILSSHLLYTINGPCAWRVACLECVEGVCVSVRVLLLRLCPEDQTKRRVFLGSAAQNVCTM